MFLKKKKKKQNLYINLEITCTYLLHSPSERKLVLHDMWLDQAYNVSALITVFFRSYLNTMWVEKSVKDIARSLTGITG